MKVKQIILIACLLGLVGCSTEPQPTQGEIDRRIQEVNSKTKYWQASQKDGKIVISSKNGNPFPTITMESPATNKGQSYTPNMDAAEHFDNVKQIMEGNGHALTKEVNR